MASLSQLTSADLTLATEFVKAYFLHDLLVFDDAVHQAVGQLLEDPSLGRFWVIESDGERCGYIVLTFGFDHEFGGRIGLVTDFFLVESARGAGLGTNAMELVLAEAKSLGLKAVELYVLDHNNRARDFYRRFGFSEVDGRAPMSLQF